MSSSGSVVTQWHLSVANHIIRIDFGPVVATVCSRLLSHGVSTFADLAKGTSLLPSQVRNALLVLLQHNLAKCVSRPAGKLSANRDPTVLYEGKLDAVFHRRWYPRMLLWVREHYGLDEEMVVQEVLTYGRLPMQRLIEQTTQTFCEVRRLAAGSAEREEQYNRFFHAATKLRVERVICESEMLPEDLAEVDSQAVDDAAVAAAVAAATRDPSPLPALPGKGGRKRKGSPLAQSSKRGGPRGYIHDEPIAPAPLMPAQGSTDAEPLLCLNMPKVLWEFKATCIKNLVGDKLDSNAEGIVDRALKLQKQMGFHSDDLGVAGMYREPFTVDAVLQSCPQRFSEDGPNITWQLCLNYLDALCSDPLCKMASTLNGKYLLELHEMCNAIKQVMVEGAVRTLVGEQGCRLFRLLCRGHSLGGCTTKGQQKYELKQLAELALLPERDARPLLWKLLNHEYVLMQEVPRSVDRNPKTTTYLWHCSLDKAYQTLERQMFKTLCSLGQRLAKERIASGEDRGEPGCRRTGLAAISEAEASEEQRQMLLCARARVEALDGAMMKLFDSALTFRNL